MLKGQRLGGKGNASGASATSALLPSKGSRKALVLGLDGSGKSCFLWLASHPKEGKLPVEKFKPTTGVQRLTRKDVQLESGRMDLDLSEVGGGLSIRSFWGRYMAQDVKVIAFFVDASAPERFSEAVLQFAVACGAAAASAPRARLVLVASRVDVPGAATTAEVHAAIRSGAAGVPLDFPSITTTELSLHGPGARASVDDLTELLAQLASS